MSGRPASPAGAPPSCRTPRPRGRGRAGPFPARGRGSSSVASRSSNSIRSLVSPWSRIRAGTRIRLAISSFAASDIAGDLDHLQAVAQRRRNPAEHVRGGDEEHLRQIERHVQVVVVKCRVSRRVERSSSATPVTSPILSSSSSTNTGVLAATLCNCRMIRPGCAPAQARCSPRRSEACRMPLHDRSANRRPSGSAMLFVKRRLARA